MIKFIFFLVSLAPCSFAFAKPGAAKSAGAQAVTHSWAPSAVPREGQFGLGLALGTIISVNGKYWISDQGALDFGLGFVSAPWTVVYADYLWHLPRIFGTGTKFGRESALYFGGGGGIGFWSGTYDCGHWSCNFPAHQASSGTGIFIRGLAGVEWYPGRTRFGVFGELGPSVMLIPGTWGTLDIDIGGRYYF